MKASETSLRNLLEGTKQFQIPLFQRPYSWEKKNWETLWEDLINLYNGEVEGSYFLGPIVTQSLGGTADGISPFIVIDGQQRLTTLTIILATLRHFLIKNDEVQAEELYELFLINKFKKGEDFYKVLPTQNDREAYRSLIEAKTDKEVKKEGRIYEAYNFFYSCLKQPNEDNGQPLDCAKFKRVILERIVLVNITSDDGDNPYLIFESLNYKGQDLTQADLVRNYIFMKLPSDLREDIYKKEWLPVQEQFQLKLAQNQQQSKRKKSQKEYAKELTNALWFYLRKDGESVNEKEIYKAMKKRFDSPNVDILLELKNIVKFAHYYLRLKFFHLEPELKLQRWFERLSRLDFKTVHIFLLNIYEKYEEKALSLEDFEKILQYLESYFVRRLFAGVHPGVLGNVFNNLYKDVQKENPDDLVNGLRTVLMGYDGTKVWPNNDIFSNGILTEDVYTKSSTVKLILESLEEEECRSKERVDTQNLTIEHIMPRTLSQEWETILGDNPENVKKKWLDTLGNLTLTAYNSELGNKSFEEKKSIYLESKVSLNQYFRDIETWNADEIKRRAEYLASIAVKVWPR